MALLILATFSLAANPDRGISSDQLDGWVELVRGRQASCGPASAWYCLQRLGQAVPLEEMIRDAPLTSEGISVEALLRLIESLAPSVKARALASNPENLDKLPTPSILILPRHAVALEGVDPQTGNARIFDPVMRKVVIEPVERVRSAWTGQAIVFGQPSTSRSAFVAIVILVALAVSSPGIWLVLFRSPSGRAESPGPPADP